MGVSGPGAGARDTAHLVASSPAPCVGLGQDGQVVGEGQDGALLGVSPH